MLNKPTVLLSLIAPVAIGAGNVVAQERPNVLVILGDDCSYSDLGCYGAVNNLTPNIDKLATEGVLFNQAYNSASMSTPTRHCLYTGMYPIKNGGYANHSRIDDGVKSMPHYMGDLGYRVGLAGKWHIQPVKSFPFEEVPGFRKNCVHEDPSYTLDGVDEFINRDSDQPFCLVLASINPHAPWTGGDESKIDRDKLILPPHFIDTPDTRDNYARYLAEITLLDNEVGDMIKLLKESDLYDNTIIFFLSEQGTKLAGAKWTNWNAGIKAGMIVRWPGHTKAGVKSDAIVQYEDVLATLIEIGGGERPHAIDGYSIAGVLDGKTKSHRNYAFALHTNVPEGPSYPIRTVVDGRYKLLHNLNYKEPYIVKHIVNQQWFEEWREKAKVDERARFILERYENRPEFELYDLKKDPFELNNLYGKSHDKKADELKKALNGWMIDQGDMGLETDK